MAQKLSTLLERINELPKHNQELVLQFKDYLDNNETSNSENNLANYMRILNLFCRFLEKKHLDKVIQQDIETFLNSKKKSVEIDPPRIPHLSSVIQKQLQYTKLRNIMNMKSQFST